MTDEEREEAEEKLKNAPEASNQENCREMWTKYMDSRSLQRLDKSMNIADQQAKYSWTKQVMRVLYIKFPTMIW